MFPEVVNWVENGVAPDSVVANGEQPRLLWSGVPQPSSLPVSETDPL